MKAPYVEVQDDLFKTAEQARDEAIARVDAAHDTWIEKFALPAIAGVSPGVRFTTDDVWDAVGDVKPPEPRALGAAMMRAKRQRLARPTADYQNSRRKECHARPVRIWERL